MSSRQRVNMLKGFEAENLLLWGNEGIPVRLSRCGVGEVLE